MAGPGAGPECPGSLMDVTSQLWMMLVQGGWTTQPKARLGPSARQQGCSAMGLTLWGWPCFSSQGKTLKLAGLG